MYSIDPSEFLDFLAKTSERMDVLLGIANAHVADLPWGPCLNLLGGPA